MEKWADYCITKVIFDQAGRMINRAIIRPDNGDSIGEEKEVTRNTLIQYCQIGKSFVTATKMETGNWRKLDNVYWNRNALYQSISIRYNDLTCDDLGNIPLLLTKRKTFVSYYHKDDENYRKQFENLTDDLIINKSVEAGDIDIDNSTEYIKQLIQKECLKDTTVLVVLVGPKTKCRKHVDWEMSGALDLKVGDSYAGLLGLLLPNHPDYPRDKYSPEKLPKRLAENAKLGYAKIYNWTTDRRQLQSYIEDAYYGRINRADKRVNRAIPQMQRNTCD